MAIIIEFYGGFNDGLQMRTDSLDVHEAGSATAIYLATESGTVGKAIMGLSNAAMGRMKELMNFDGHDVNPEAESLDFVRHIYEVAEKNDTDGHTLVRFEFKCHQPPPT